MRFFDDMECKIGFGDGSAYPDGVRVYRDLYVRTINKLAARKGSRYRVAAQDRAGFHNFCMIVRVSLKNPKEYVPKGDRLLEEAIDDAMELDVDSFVRVKVKVSRKRFEKFLKGPMLVEDES
jgi:hypothetical protein